ncbi:kinase-like domain-containing protein [Mycena leptocephala]|nr:kinase-like domain-containing protein [Mycena leptocephala]
MTKVTNCTRLAAFLRVLVAMTSPDPYLARARFARNLEGIALPLFPRKYLAHGGFGDVMEGTLKKDDGAILNVAIKRMRFSSHDKKDFLGELHTWSKLNHPNILELLGYIEVDNTVGIVSPLIMNGHATSYFANHRTTDPGSSLCDVADALSYLHGLNIYHGDLKGMGSPERINGGLSATAEGDIYSFGMTALELCTLVKPYNEIPSDPACIVPITRGQLPQRPSGVEALAMSDAWWNLFESCCRYVSGERPKIEDVLRRLGEPAYRTVFKETTELRGKSDLAFVMIGAGEGRRDRDQVRLSLLTFTCVVEFLFKILLTLTPAYVDARVSQCPLAWKRSQCAILNQNGAFVPSGKFRSGSLAIGVQNKSGVPVTLALCKNDVLVEFEPPLLLQAYVVSNYQGILCTRNGRGDPQPLDISQLPSFPTPTFYLKAGPSGSVTLDKAASSAFQV